MLITAAELVERNPGASREEIRDQISGNLCRCTGYQSIVEAIFAVCAARLADAGTSTQAGGYHG
jgi:carbon-monoxide dehydrogenase small subunit